MSELPPETQALLDAVKTATDLTTPPIPERPSLQGLGTRCKLEKLSRYICAFEYNHTGRPYFQLKRDRGVGHITTTAKEIMREALPIQCVEAVFLGFYLTADLENIERFPLSFKSSCGSRCHRHIVLAIHDKATDLWGALGISRRKALQSKDLRFKSLADLVRDYKKSYEHLDHRLLKVYVGLPFPHNVHSSEPVKWRVLKLAFDSDSDLPDDSVKMLNEYAMKDAFVIRDHFYRTGKLPEPFETSKPKNDDASSTATTPVATFFRRRSSTARTRRSSVPVVVLPATKKSQRRKSDPLLASPPRSHKKKILVDLPPPLDDEAGLSMVFSPSPSSPGMFSNDGDRSPLMNC